MTQPKQDTLGFSQSELKTYMTLLSHSPANGSQLSRFSGIPRANIYAILNSLKTKGVVGEIEEGIYTPLPSDEFLKRLKNKANSEIETLEKQFEAVSSEPYSEYIWTIKGYEKVLNKAIEIINVAEKELYVLLYPEEAQHLDPHLKKAEERGVKIKYISMGVPQVKFDIQVVHPGFVVVEQSHEGRVIDIVKDKTEILVGLFEKDREDESPINWARHHWFVMALRETIRHDFYHYLVHKMLDQGLELDDNDRNLYKQISTDTWAGKT